MGFPLFVQKLLQDGFRIDANEFLPNNAIEAIDIGRMNAEAVVDHHEMMDAFGFKTIDGEHHVRGVQGMNAMGDYAVRQLPRVDLSCFILLIHNKRAIQCHDACGFRFPGFMNHTSGTSNSPGLIPFGLDLTSLTASCAIAGGCTGANALHVIYSDINFAIPVGGFTTTYSATITGGGSTSESAFVDNTNTLFGEPAAGLIGTVGPFVAPSGAGSATGGGAGVPPYSLTLDAVFSGVSSSFSVDGNVTAAPEPSSLLLIGAGLLGFGLLLRKKQIQSVN